MWLSDRQSPRRFFRAFGAVFERLRAFGVASGALVLTACGFSPLYGPETAASRMTGQVSVDEIDGLMGFALRKRLTERLGTVTDPQYALSVTLDVSAEGLAISQDNEITRYNLTGTATYQLRDITVSTALATGTVRAFAAHSATASPVATRIAERDARARLATSLADQIASRLAVAAAGLAP